MLDPYLQKHAAKRDEAFRPFDIATITASMWMGSPGSMEFATFLHHAVSHLLKRTPDDPPQAETVGDLWHHESATPTR